MIDAIYIPNYIVNKKIIKKKEKIFAFFVDLKMAFDRIDRVKLAEMFFFMFKENRNERTAK